MRTKSVYLMLAAVISCSLISFTTNNTLFDNPKDTQTGIYHNFEDYQVNSPTMDLDYNIIATPYYHGFLKNKKVDYFQLEVTQKDQRKELRSIFGFRDRFYFYINPSYPKRLPKYRHFVKVEDFGQFWYYQTFPENFIGQASVVQSNMVEVLFDTETMEKVYLTNAKMEEILNDDKKLFKDFQADKKNRKKYKEYLQSYFSRKHDLDY